MAESSGTDHDTLSKKYHHHPLSPNLPLKEAVRRGLAVPEGAHYENDDFGRNNMRLEMLRPTKSTDNFRQDFSRVACEQHDRVNKSPHGITRYSGRAPKPLKKMLSLGNMKDVPSPKSPSSIDTEVGENVRKEIQERVQETAQQLRDRLGLHGPVPIPAPLNIPKKKIPKPTLARIDEDNYDRIGNQSTAAERAASPGLSPISYGTTQPYYSRLPRYKPQAKPHPTKTVQAKNQEDVFMLTPPRSSSLHALASASSPYPSSTIKTTSSTPLLGSFDKDLPDLPRHLQPGNQYSPRRLASSANAHISFAATAMKHNHETGEIIETPVKIQRGSRIQQKAAMNQGTSQHSPASSICSFTGANKQLEADILALLDNMAGAAKHLSAPPPCAPPNYPPPSPPLYRHIIVRDFSLPASAYVNTLANPYEDEAADVNTGDAHTNTVTCADDDTGMANGGWMAMQQRAHQRVMAPYLAAAAAREQSRNNANALSRAVEEVLRMADEAEAEAEAEAVTAATTTTAATGVTDEASCEHSDPAPTTAPASSGTPSEVGTTGAASSSASVPSARSTKSPFLQRCGKALAKKRSFWNKQNGEK
ncbi:hypothetical protein F5Y10DRAFT_283160 [Nemania abortiva]|nr:hypothetical protein F5Y10DRAFT_283160 [Nemania abortiva]